MVNERLVYFLEKMGLLGPHQSGFRRGKGTVDAVVYLEDEISKAQVDSLWVPCFLM